MFEIMSYLELVIVLLLSFTHLFSLHHGHCMLIGYLHRIFLHIARLRRRRILLALHYYTICNLTIVRLHWSIRLGLGLKLSSCEHDSIVSNHLIIIILCNEILKQPKGNLLCSSDLVSSFVLRFIKIISIFFYENCTTWCIMLSNILYGRCFPFFTKKWLIYSAFNFMKIFMVHRVRSNTFKKCFSSNRIGWCKLFSYRPESHGTIRKSWSISIDIIANFLGPISVDDS